MTRPTLRIAGIAATILLASCGEEPASSGSGGRGKASAPPGILEGVVRFEGELPPPRRVRVTKDEDHCRAAAVEVQDVVFSPDHGLAGVVVEIHDVPEEGKLAWPPAESGYAIRQKGCRFEPWLLVVPPGSELAVYNDDPVLHNINTGQWNVAQYGGNREPSLQRIDYDGRSLVRVNCDIHSWMEAWIYVPRTPYYAVTDSEGKFRIPEIPPGKYRVTATHPALGEERIELEVAGGDVALRTLTFHAR